MLNSSFFESSPYLIFSSTIKLTTHFTGSSLWDFKSENFMKLCNSWNTNLKVILDFPWSTHCYIVERLSGIKHAKHMIFSRYIKFLDSLVKNRRKSIVSLVKIVSNVANSVTGSNIRHILNETGTLIVPGKTMKFALNNYEVYSVPSKEEWRIPLLSSLIEMKEKRWIVQFDEEDDGTLNDDAINLMIERACID